MRKAISKQRIFGVPGGRTRQDRDQDFKSFDKQPRILIVCEGKKTEPNYFKAFRVTNDVFGKGIETMRVVEEAIRLNREAGPYDQIWCVFDRDDFPPDDFDNAIKKVESLAKEGFRVAYSNQSFELWYVLHFENLESDLHRSQYIDRLNIHLGQKYNKSDSNLYDLLKQKGNEKLALRYADSLREKHKEETSFSKRGPETTVDLLVKELRQIQRRRIGISL